MVFYISGPKLLFETTEISTHPNSTQQESNYIYLYTTKFGTSIKIRLNRKFESTEFETTRVNCIKHLKYPESSKSNIKLIKCLIFLVSYAAESKQTSICGVMVSVLTSSTVNCGFEFRIDQSNDDKFGICCFSSKHTALRRKSKDWLT